MRNISVGQILVLLVICFLLFGDLKKFKKRVKSLTFELNKLLKNKKKGI